MLVEHSLCSNQNDFLSSHNSQIRTKPDLLLSISFVVCTEGKNIELGLQSKINEVWCRLSI